MTLLLIYFLVALVFSFLCSVAEAVLLSVTPSYIALLEQEGKPSGQLLQSLCGDINRPLAAILSLNTIAHTLGAAGAGAQAAVVFGSDYVGVASAVLTLLILIFSEIIPKTLGANNWRYLAPVTAHGLKWLVRLLYPLVILAEQITQRLSGRGKRGISRGEFSALARLSAEEGELAQRENKILQNLLLLHEIRIKNAMTPRTVVFALDEQTSVAEFIKSYSAKGFSRIPIYRDKSENITAYVLRSDLLLAEIRDEGQKKLKNYRRELPALLASMSLSHAFDELQRRSCHILLAVDEYGGTEGILTLEDVLETLLGLEIIDENDTVEDMQKLALRLWQRRSKKNNLTVDDD